jgi:glycine/D-amino acid oxidase-like deaminating enzyme
MGVDSGKLKSFANTPAQSLIVEDGKIKGVKTHRGTIMADHVVVCAGLWGRLIANMVGEDLPVMPVDHPLTFFGPFNEFEGTGKDIGYPLLRDQGNSAYMRDTGDPKTTEGGQIEWGYYETTNPRMCHPRDLQSKEEARLSPSQRDLELEQVIEPLEKAMELTPILSELGYNETWSFNGLLQVSAAGGPSCGESQKVRGLWYCRRHLGQGRSGLRQADRRLDDRRPHRDRSCRHRLFPFLSAPNDRKVHRGPVLRSGAEDLLPCDPPA